MCRPSTEMVLTMLAVTRWKHVLFGIFLGILGLSLYWKVLGSGYLVSGDNSTHLAEILALLDAIGDGQNWWTIWYEGDYGGYPVLTYQYPLGKWAVLLLSFLPGIGVAFAYKVVLFLSWILPAWALWRLLEDSAGSTTASLAALLYLANLDSLYLSLGGMWNQFLCLGLVLIGLRHLHSLVREPSYRSAGMLAIYLSLALVSHQFAVILIPPAWLAGAFFGLRAFGVFSKFGRCLFLVPALVILLTSWYTLPILGTLNWPQLQFVEIDFQWIRFLFPLVYSGIADVEGSGFLIASDLLRYSSGMLLGLVPGILGLVWLTAEWFRGQAISISFSLLGWFSAFLGLLLVLLSFDILPILGQARPLLFAGRFAPALLVCLGFGVAFLFRQNVKKRKDRGIMSQVFLGLLTGLLSLRIVIAIVSGGIENERFVLLYQPGRADIQEIEALEQTWDWLRGQLPAEGERILVQDTLFNLKGSPLYWSHMPALTHNATGLWTIGSFSEGNAPLARLTKTEAGMIFGRRVSVAESADLLKGVRDFNCTFVLACEPKLMRLIEESGEFDEVYVAKPFKVYRFKQMNNWADFLQGDGLIKVESFDQGLSRLKIVVSSSSGGLIRFASGHHPWWKYRSGEGHEYNAEAGSDGFVNVRLEGPGEYDITLAFQPPVPVPGLLTVLGLAILAIAFFLDTRKAATDP